MARRKRLINKKLTKLVAKTCRICPTAIYDALEVHRIIAGSIGGEYTSDNSVVLCSNCHALVTTGLIRVEGWVHSTAGRLLHWWDQSGVEHFS